MHTGKLYRTCRDRGIPLAEQPDGVEHHVPGEAQILAVDGGRGREVGCIRSESRRPDELMPLPTSDRLVLHVGRLFVVWTRPGDRRISVARKLFEERVGVEGLFREPYAGVDVRYS